MAKKKSDKTKLKMKRTTVSNLGRAAGGTSPLTVTVETVEATATVAEGAESAAAAGRGGGILSKIVNSLGLFGGGGGGGGGGGNDRWSGHPPSAGASLKKG